MNKMIVVVAGVAFVLIVLLSFLPLACERRVEAAVERLEQEVESRSPGLYTRVLPADDFRQMLDGLPEVSFLSAGRLAEWAEQVDNLSMETAVLSAKEVFFRQVRRVVNGLRLGVVLFAFLAVSCVILWSKVSAEEEANVSGIRFGDWKNSEC